MPVRPRQRQHLHGWPCRTRRRARSAPTAAAVAAADPATVAATSTAAPAAAAAAGGRGEGFSSQAWPTSAGWLAAVGEVETDVEAPTWGAAAPEEVVSDSLDSDNRQNRQHRAGGGRTSWYPIRRRREVRGTSLVHPSPGQFRRPCSTVRKRG